MSSLVIDGVFLGGAAIFAIPALLAIGFRAPSRIRYGLAAVALELFVVWVYLRFLR